MSKAKILYVKPGTNNVIAFPGVEVRQAKKKRKVKRERLPPSIETPIDEDEDDWPVDERLIARTRGRWRYDPKTPNRG